MAGDFEQLGAFFLGHEWDLDARRRRDDLVLYDSKDLTTHAVVVGMTGSGKTGLGISLIEEAALDGVPVIAIDPKGDLGNLALTFPKLRPDDFAPWIDAQTATRAGRTVPEQATWTADLWREGLTATGQSAARIGRLRSAAEVAIFTPGSTCGRPLTVLASFAAPSAAVIADEEALVARVRASASGLLALVGLEVDPLRSREHILVANILDRAWRAGRSLDLAGLIGAIQSPPFERVGVFDLETFFPAADRLDLAMRLNNLLASPGFATWLEGEPLDVAHLLHANDGRPRVAVISIAHLAEAERMFVVTLLLNEVLSWARSQPGTSSLRAILYMDEVFGYMPPTREPPSKTPLLTLLKQARAYGLGCVLATQNPVDLDYKALSNAGTWFLGRLQTERDKERVLAGLEGASTSSGLAFDRKKTEAILAGLSSRVFLMRNVHEDDSVLFHTRWAMSYLRGPLTLAQIETLEGRRATQARPAAKPERIGDPLESARPITPTGVRHVHLERRGSEGRAVYRPAVLAGVRLHFVRSRQKIDIWRELTLLTPLPAEGDLDWETATELAEPPAASTSTDGARYTPLPAAAMRASTWKAWPRELAADLYRRKALTIWRAPGLRVTSAVDETEAQFRARLRERLREERDRKVEKLRTRHAPKLERLRDRIRRAEERVGREESQYRHQKTQTALSIGATVLGALFGRKLASRSNIGRATTSARSASRAARELEDIDRARREVEEQRRKLVELEEQFQEQLAELKDEADVDEIELQELTIRPRKSDTDVHLLKLAWVPWVEAHGGRLERDAAVRPRGD